MNFKEAVRDDIDKCFLDVTELADYHEINGQSVRAVIDTDGTEGEALIEYHGQWRSKDPGLSNGDIAVYVSSAEMKKPAARSLLVIDGERYIIRSVADEDGMLKITASRAEGR